MRIYVCHSRSFDYVNELYRPIRQHFPEDGPVFVFPHENGINEDSRAVIPSCQLVVADVSVPATGVGIELGRAEAAGIPIACIHRSGTAPSSSLKRLTRVFREYDSQESMLAAIDDILRSY
ncbi:MAG TPA: hypothetical protein VN420_02280 [Candidatus Fimivivens sp.]|nr:hypothetical protein [Candidatus Fimivivens sp.]